jgi:hypothetical protein
MQRKLLTLLVTAALVASASLSWGMSIQTQSIVRNIIITGMGLTFGDVILSSDTWSGVNGVIGGHSPAVETNNTFINGGGISGSTYSTDQTQTVTYDSTTPNDPSNLNSINTTVTAVSTTPLNSVWSGAIGTISFAVTTPVGGEFTSVSLAFDFITKILASLDPNTDTALVGQGGAEFWVDVNGVRQYTSAWLGGVYAHTSVLNNVNHDVFSNGVLYNTATGLPESFGGAIDPLALVLLANATYDITIGTYTEAIVPEPSTLLLAGSGLLGIFFLRRRSAKA